MKKQILAALALSATLLAPAAAAPSDDAMKAASVMVAMGGFAKESCPGLNPNLLMMRAYLDRIGVDPEMLEARNRMIQIGLIKQAMESNITESCRIIREQFGPSGTNVPGLLDTQ